VDFNRGGSLHRSLSQGRRTSGHPGRAWPRRFCQRARGSSCPRRDYSRRRHACRVFREVHRPAGTVDIAGCGYFPWEPGIYAHGPGQRAHRRSIVPNSGRSWTQSRSSP